MPTNYHRTAAWLKACGKTPGDAAHISVQIGCHLEEITELLRCLRVSSEGGSLVLKRTIEDVEWLAAKIKRGDYLAHIPPHQRKNALDALCDCEVTGNGTAYLEEMDKTEADRRVLDSNDSKLEEGRAVVLPGGKIGKGKYYAPPKLEDLV